MISLFLSISKSNQQCKLNDTSNLEKKNQQNQQGVSKCTLKFRNMTHNQHASLALKILSVYY